MKPSGILLLATWLLAAQIPNPTQQPVRVTAAEEGLPSPVFRVTVVSRSIRAINYHHRRASTRVDLRGTELLATARGQAKVESQMGSTKIETDLENLVPASRFGPEYLTYVLWAITPEGRAVNLGELVLRGDDAQLLSTTELQTFGLIVTAEPYFAVTQPSDVVVAENLVRDDTTGTFSYVDAKYELLQRGQYVFNRADYKPVAIDPKGPLQLAQAENAVEIARLAGAERYAAETIERAKVGLQNARGFLDRGDRRRSETNAREATQMAEDARIITIRKIREEQLAAERAAAAKREAEEREKAEQATNEARLEQERRAQAEAARREAEEAAARATQQRTEAESARAAALAEQQAARIEAERARLSAEEAERQRRRAENEKTELRARLRQQLNSVLETRETQRGLIVNISDVQFDFNKFTLKPGAREKLAKVSGILLAYPGLKVQLEGHTDSVGSDEYNLKLSEQRADAVRSYLVSQGVPTDTVTAAGLGKSQPVASNDTAAGRQQNRRVEMVVAGDPIGVESEQPVTSDSTPR